MTADPFNLGRFVEAQQETFAGALAEIRRGAKRGHWMWYIFPQIQGLGRSTTAQRFAIKSIDEAHAYLAHPLLGSRLKMCVEALQDLVGPSAADIFGPVDAVKLRSSLTLFDRAGGGAIFEAALARWFGAADPLTIKLIAQICARRSIT